MHKTNLPSRILYIRSGTHPPCPLYTWWSCRAVSSIHSKTIISLAKRSTICHSVLRGRVLFRDQDHTTYPSRGILPLRERLTMPFVLRLRLRLRLLSIVLRITYRPVGSSLRFVFVVRLSVDTLLLVLCFRCPPTSLEIYC